MRLALSFLFLLFFSVPVFAQNWRTVNPHDTVYFKCIATSNYGAVRMVYVDSIKISNGDSACYFYKTMRAEDNSITSCVDTNAPSWMGFCCLRQAGGAELYFNELHDTIRVLTQASVADSWIMAKDTSGNVFYATVLAADTATIDGVLDSVKTFGIQAMSGGSPVSHYYNAFTIKWSKDHGWLQTLDWYAFPNTIVQPYRWGARLMPFLFERLSMTFKAKDFSQPDLLWKYAPGNEWFWSEDLSALIVPTSQPDVAYTFDSIINSSLINSNTLLVTLQEKRRVVTHNVVNNQWVTVSDNTTTVIRTDTIIVSTYDPVRTHVYPDLKPRTVGMMPFIFDYALDTFCAGRYRFSDKYTNMAVVSPNGSCLAVGPNITGGNWGDHVYLDGFGVIVYNRYMYFGTGTTDRHTVYSYLKLGGCVLGNKATSTVWLGMNEPRMQSNFVSVYPNPANDNITIAVSETSDVSILDITGRLVNTAYLSKGDNHLSVADLPAGMYILRVSGKDKVLTQKLIKN